MSLTSKNKKQKYRQGIKMEGLQPPTDISHTHTDKHTHKTPGLILTQRKVGMKRLECDEQAEWVELYPRKGSVPMWIHLEEESCRYSQVRMSVSRIGVFIQQPGFSWERSRAAWRGRVCAEETPPVIMWHSPDTCRKGRSKRCTRKAPLRHGLCLPGHGACALLMPRAGVFWDSKGPGG